MPTCLQMRLLGGRDVSGREVWRGKAVGDAANEQDMCQTWLAPMQLPDAPQAHMHMSAGMTHEALA